MPSHLPVSSQIERESMLVRQMVFDTRDGLHKPPEAVAAGAVAPGGIAAGTGAITEQAFRYSLAWLYQQAAAATPGEQPTLKTNDFFTDIEGKSRTALEQLLLKKTPKRGGKSIATKVFFALNALNQPLYSNASHWLNNSKGSQFVDLLFYITLQETLTCCMAEAAMHRESQGEDVLPPDEDDQDKADTQEEDIEEGHSVTEDLQPDLALLNAEDAEPHPTAGSLRLRLSHGVLADRIWRAVAYETNALLANAGVEGFKVTSRRAHRLGSDSVLRNFEKLANVKHADGVKMAAVLLAAVLEAGAGKLLSLRKEPGTRDVLRVTLHQPLIDFVRNLENRFVPVNAPMVALPMGWGAEQGTSQGAYHQRDLSFFKIRSKNLKVRGFIRAVNAEKLEGVAVANSDDNRKQALVHMFNAVNHCQDTAWRVNQALWSLVEQLLNWRAELASRADEGAIKRDLVEGALFPKSSFGKSLLLAVGQKLPAPAPPQDHKDQWQAWLQTAAFEETRFIARRWVHRGPGALLRDALTRVTIEDAAAREKFWFGYQADLRGRIYPLAGVFSPQGHEIVRSLMEFADGKPLATDAGRDALAVYGTSHVADSVIQLALSLPTGQLPSTQDRLAWVLQVQNSLIAPSATDPFSHVEWRSVAKRPFLFLAFCKAWKGYMDAGLGYVCHLPVHIDGTCNGLQHIAVLTGSAKLAQATNVAPTVNPQGKCVRRDIYSEVAAQVAQALQGWAAALASGHKPPTIPTWLKHPPLLRAVLCNEAAALLTRDLAKKVVMVIPYGAGFTARCDRLRTGLSKAMLLGFDELVALQKLAPLMSVDELFRPHWRSKLASALAGSDLAALVAPPGAEKASSKKGKKPNAYASRQPKKKSPETEQLHPLQAQARGVVHAWSVIVAKAFEDVLARDYPEISAFESRLKDAVKPLLSAGLPVTWVTPEGLPVLQNRFEQEAKTIETEALGRIRLTLVHATEEIDSRKQTQALLPNLIHSMDACHLVMTVNLAQSHGLNAFSVIHDSYGSHACDVPTLKQCAQEAFVQLYQQPDATLAYFEQWANALAGKTPELEASLAAQWLAAGQDPKLKMRLALLNLTRTWRGLPCFDATHPTVPAQLAVAAPPRLTSVQKPPEWLPKVVGSEYFFC